jgi:hypothetical protein
MLVSINSVVSDKFSISPHTYARSAKCSFYFQVFLKHDHSVLYFTVIFQTWLSTNKILYSALFPFFHFQMNTGDTMHETSLLYNICSLPRTCQASVNADSMFVQITTVTSALCLYEKGRGQNVEMTHFPPAPLHQLNISTCTSSRPLASRGQQPDVRGVPLGQCMISVCRALVSFAGMSFAATETKEICHLWQEHQMAEINSSVPHVVVDVVRILTSRSHTNSVTLSL